MGDTDPISEEASPAASNNLPPAKSTSNQKIRVFSLSSVAIYTLVYLTLSSNPSVQKTELYTIQNRTVLKQVRQDHLQKAASRISRAYPDVSASNWCIDGALRHEQAKRRPMGLCYLKLPRAASSTLAGINKRIAVNFARRQGLTNSCIRHDGHVVGMYYQKRQELSFLWTSVRDPASRALSRVGYTFSSNPEKLTNQTLIMSGLRDADVQYGAVSYGRGGFQLQYTMHTIIDEWSAWNASNPTHIINPSIIQQHVAQVIASYNFIAIVERLDESLVALQLLLGLDVYDILHFSSKFSSTSYERRQIKNGRRKEKKAFQCVKLQQAKPTRAVNNYFESDEWFAQNYGDYLLYVAASQSLDRTIQRFGTARFEQELERYRSLQKQALETCIPTFPCSTNGTDQDEESKSQCYAFDEGCGFPCLDDMMKRSVTANGSVTESQKVL
jgi:hypothetical protein